MILKNNWRNQLCAKNFYFYSTIFIIVILIIARFQKNIFLGYIIFYMIGSLPAFYLHIVYYFSNKNQEIILEERNIIVKFNSKNKNKEKKFIFKNEDIQKMIYYRSRSIDKGGMPFTPMEYYNYIRLITNTGVHIIITCFMHKDLYEIVDNLKNKDIPFERKVNSFFLLNNNILSYGYKELDK